MQDDAPLMASPTFGQRLRQRREELGLTRRALEDESGVSVRQIEYLEKNKHEPRRDTLESLAKVLGPEIIEAAFPKLVLLRSRRRTNPGYVAHAEQAMSDCIAATRLTIDSNSERTLSWMSIECSYRRHGLTPLHRRQVLPHQRHGGLDPTPVRNVVCRDGLPAGQATSALNVPKAEHSPLKAIQGVPIYLIDGEAKARTVLIEQDRALAIEEACCPSQFMGIHSPGHSTCVDLAVESPRWTGEPSRESLARLRGAGDAARANAGGG